MKKILAGRLHRLGAIALLLLAPSIAQAGWFITSPDHEQTFSYGTESNRAWAERGRDHHLVLLINFTNDPFVDRQNPREYDNFTFSFPRVVLGRDGSTFYYHAPDGAVVPVARRSPGFLGIQQIDLLPSAYLIVRKPHGYLTLTIVVQGH